jgi:hypothetical protein
MDATASGVHATAALPPMLDQACAAALLSAASNAAERVLQSCECVVPRQAAVAAGASLTASTAAKPVRPTELAPASSSSSGALQTLNLRLCTAQRLATELRAALPPTLPTTALTKLTELARHLAAAAEAVSAETEVEAAAVAAAAPVGPQAARAAVRAQRPRLLAQPTATSAAAAAAAVSLYRAYVRHLRRRGRRCSRKPRACGWQLMTSTTTAARYRSHCRASRAYST